MTKSAFIKEVHDAEAMLYHVAKSILKNDADCCDAVQETLARKDPVMKDVILQPHKTLRHCLEYVHEKAYETALEKAKKEGKTGVGQNAGIVIGSTEVFAWGIDYYLLDDRKEMEKKAQEEKDTIKKAWKRAESIRTVSAKSKDSDTKKDVSEEAKVAAKPAAQKKEEPEQLSLFNLGA